MITQKIICNKQTGQIEEFKEFFDGKLVTIERYYPNGNLQQRKDYDGLFNYDGIGRLHGLIIICANDKVFSKSIYLYGQKNGIHIRYSILHGGLDLICEYKNGEKHGIEKAYHDNGKIWYINYFIDGVEQKDKEIYFKPDGTTYVPVK
jgi:antitoxin component YwqK of YwqJK toxin-antitoxin module